MQTTCEIGFICRQPVHPTEIGGRCTQREIGCRYTQPPTKKTIISGGARLRARILSSAPVADAPDADAIAPDPLLFAHPLFSVPDSRVSTRYVHRIECDEMQDRHVMLFNVVMLSNVTSNVMQCRACDM